MTDSQSNKYEGSIKSGGSEKKVEYNEGLPETETNINAGDTTPPTVGTAAQSEEDVHKYQGIESYGSDSLPRILVSPDEEDMSEGRKSRSESSIKLWEQGEPESRKEKESFWTKVYEKIITRDPTFVNECAEHVIELEKADVEQISSAAQADLAENPPPLQMFPPNTRVTIMREDKLDDNIDKEYQLPFQDDQHLKHLADVVIEAMRKRRQIGEESHLSHDGERLETVDTIEPMESREQHDVRHLNTGNKPNSVESRLFPSDSSAYLRPERSEVARYFRNLYDGKTQRQKARERDNKVSFSFRKYMADKFRQRFNNCARFLRQLKYKEYLSLPFLTTDVENIKTNFGSAVGDFFASMRQIIVLHVVIAILWTALVVLPEICAFDHDYEHFHLRSLVTVTGPLAKSWFFYGAYEHTVPPFDYPMDVIYMVCVYVTYFALLIVLIEQKAEALIHADDKESKKYEFCSAIFGWWDHGFSAVKGRSMQTKALCRTVQKLIHNHETDLLDAYNSLWNMVLNKIRQGIAWLLSFCICAVSGVAIFFTFGTDLVSFFHRNGYQIEPDNFVVTVGPGVLFTILNGLFSETIYWVPLLERYNREEDQRYANIVRVYILRTSNTLVLIAALRRRISYGYFVGCSGTLLAMELYKIILFDTIAGVFSTVFPCFIKTLQQNQRIEFGIASHVLKLTYRIRLIWLAIIVCPIMPVVAVFSLLTFFYTCYYSVIWFARPPMTRWNEGQRGTFFAKIMILNMVIVFSVVSFITSTHTLFKIGEVRARENPRSLLGRVVPDQYCGPLDTTNGTSVTEAWLDTMKTGDSRFRVVLQFVTSYTFVLPLAFLLISVIYYQNLQIRVETEVKVRLDREMEFERQQHRAVMMAKMFDGQGKQVVKEEQLKVDVQLLLNVRSDDEVKDILNDLEVLNLRHRRRSPQEQNTRKPENRPHVYI